MLKHLAERAKRALFEEPEEKSDINSENDIDKLLNKTKISTPTEEPSQSETPLDIPVEVEAVKTDSGLDFNKIYTAAKIPSCLFGAEKLLEMVNSLPSSLPRETKLQTVLVSLSALGQSSGTSPEVIKTDANTKSTVLRAYASNLHKRTSEFCDKTNAEIAELEASIESKKREILRANSDLENTHRLCNEEAVRLQTVLYFFEGANSATKNSPTNTVTIQVPPTPAPKQDSTDPQIDKVISITEGN